MFKPQNKSLDGVFFWQEGTF